jgi:hypothetical protein
VQETDRVAQARLAASLSGAGRRRITAMVQPSWAVERARAALNVGMKAPEVEQHLIAKGLSPAEANDVVMSILEGRVRTVFAPLASEERSRPAQLVVSVLLAGVCLALVYWLGGGGPTAWTLVCILPGLAGIWLPEMMSWEWNMASTGCRAVGWVWLLLFGGGRVILVAIYNQPV